MINVQKLGTIYCCQKWSNNLLQVLYSSSIVIIKELESTVGHRFTLCDKCVIARILCNCSFLGEFRHQFIMQVLLGVIYRFSGWFRCTWRYFGLRWLSCWWWRWWRRRWWWWWGGWSRNRSWFWRLCILYFLLCTLCNFLAVHLFLWKHSQTSNVKWLLRIVSTLKKKSNCIYCMNRRENVFAVYGIIMFTGVYDLWTILCRFTKLTL